MALIVFTRVIQVYYNTFSRKQEEVNGQLRLDPHIFDQQQKPHPLELQIRSLSLEEDEAHNVVGFRIVHQMSWNLWVGLGEGWGYGVHRISDCGGWEERGGRGEWWCTAEVCVEHCASSQLYNDIVMALTSGHVSSEGHLINCGPPKLGADYASPSRHPPPGFVCMHLPALQVGSSIIHDLIVLSFGEREA